MINPKTRPISARVPPKPNPRPGPELLQEEVKPCELIQYSQPPASTVRIAELAILKLIRALINQMRHDLLPRFAGRRYGRSNKEGCYQRSTYPEYSRYNMDQTKDNNQVIHLNLQGKKDLPYDNPGRPGLMLISASCAALHI